MSAQGIDIGVHVSVRNVGPSALATYTSRLTLIGLDEVDGVGDYWCQVRLENGTLVKEKSNILTIGSAIQYQDLKRCVAGIGQTTEQVKCLQITSATATGAMDGAVSTNPGHEFQTPFNSVVPPTFQTTTDHTEERDSGSERNLITMYATIASVIFSLVITTLLIVIVIATLRCKWKSNRGCEQSKQPEFKAAKQLPYNHGNSPVTQCENFDFMENVAYSEVGKNVIKDSSFVTRDLSRSASSPEYDDILTLR